ncbi:hypothetical protein ACNHKD_12945 [Methylocystis sp. JAN1]|uniref:hypothetical protein n=1 Tax=Methylocystis sp. JAN1 TaxID=3397211 RepID=UPI003FA1B947
METTGRKYRSEILLDGRSGGATKKPVKSKASTRPTGENKQIDNKGLSSESAHRPRAQKKTAVPAGPRNGGETSAKARKNLHVQEYLDARIDAIALAVDPHLADLEKLDRLIALADEAAPDPEREPWLGSVAMVDQRLWALFGAQDDREGPNDDLEPDDHPEDKNSPVHLDGGNGDVPTKEDNLAAEEKRRATAEKDAAAQWVWDDAQSARIAANLPFAPWTPENQRRAEAGLPLLSYGEMRQ